MQIYQQKRYGDSQGRTRTEFTTHSENGEASRTTVTVFDPRERISLNWTIGDHIESTYFVNTMGHEAASMPKQSYPSPTQSGPKILRTNEQLGIQEIQGFPCTATRSTVVYPIGTVGNDRPITSVYERCTSSEFGFALSDKSIDPRSGTFSLTAISISREEPTPSLFQPPAGFIERKTVSVPPTTRP